MTPEIKERTAMEDGYRLLNDTCESILIKIEDESASSKNRKYVPYWA